MVLMDTVRHDKNGHVIGFDRLNIDPMATQRRVLAELEKGGITQKLASTQDAVKAAVTIIPDPKGAIVRYAPNYGQLMTEHNRAVAQYAAEHKELTAALVVYFQPRAGEVVLSADELARLQELWASLKKGQKLTLEGKVIDGGSG
jgi:hypothetical protein